MTDLAVGTGAIATAGALTGSETLVVLQSGVAKEVLLNRLLYLDASSVVSVPGSILFSAGGATLTFNSGGPRLALVAANTLAFFSDGNNYERIRYDGSGVVTINGARNSSGNAQGSGNLRVLAPSAGGICISTYDTTDHAAMSFVRDVSGTPTQKGSISVSNTGVTYGTTSDYRGKFNVQDLSEEEAIAAVMARRPRTYEIYDMPGVVLRGYIAHELQQVKPQAVNGQKDAVEEIGTAVLQVADERGRPIIGETVEFADIPAGEAPEGAKWKATGERDVLQSVDMGQAGDPDIVRALQAALRRIAALEAHLGI